jgi:hypothetical protein
MEQAFVNLMDRFTTALILTQYSPEHQCIVETITSDFALGAVISQKGGNDKLYPIAYHSRKFSSAEINNEIHDKELLAVVDSFKTWRKYLDGALLPVRVYTDHQNLEYSRLEKYLIGGKPVGPRNCQHGSQNLLLSQVTKRQAGCTLTAVGVLPSERGK